jgi:hypothetical protein
MVIRKLYSNALDEQGETTIQSSDISLDSLAGKSAIVLRSECFPTVRADRRNHFPAHTEACAHASPFVNASDALCHDHADSYRGIKFFDAKLPTLYRYDIFDEVTLTEDRTSRYEFELKEVVEMTIITAKDAGAITRRLSPGPYVDENYLSFGRQHSGVQMSDEFEAICRKSNERKPRNLNMAAIRWYPARGKTLQPTTFATLMRVQQSQLDKAVAFVQRIGFGDDFDAYPVNVVNWPGEGIYRGVREVGGGTTTPVNVVNWPGEGIYGEARDQSISISEE